MVRVEHMILPVKAILLFSTGGLLLAQLPAAAPLPAVDALGRLSLDAALVAAVVALWRALGTKDVRIAEKDAQIVAMATKITDAMVTGMEAIKELRGELRGVRLEGNTLKKREDAHRRP